MRNFQKEMRDLFSDIENDVEEILKAQMKDATNEEKIKHLTQVAYSNRSTWSGGTVSSSNIFEAIHREKALEMLESITMML